MVIKNKNKILLFAVFSQVFLLLSGCQLFQRNRSSQTFTPQVVSATAKTAGVDSVPTETDGLVLPQKIDPQDVSVSPLKIPPKFGLIFSAGGAKAWAHVGVLKEMQKYKFPVVSLAGIEWGSVVAAVYAQNASVNEVEWELSKFKDIDDWQDFLKDAFARKSTFDLKIPFVCPSLNLKNKTSYMLNRGQLDQFLPFCLPSAGIIKPFGQSVAHLGELHQTVQHLKSTGANKIILINVLAGKNAKALINNLESSENQIWTQHAVSMAKKLPGIDEVIEIDLGHYEIDEFDRRREFMVKGSDLGYNQIKKIADKYRL